MRNKLRAMYQVQCMGVGEIADELDMHPNTVRRKLSELGVGEPTELLREEGGPDLLVDVHGSPEEAAEAVGVSHEKFSLARYEPPAKGK